MHVSPSPLESDYDANCALQLQHNRLTGLPYSFGDIVTLEYLDLSQNDFDVVPESLTTPPRLKVLNLQGNGCTKLPVSLGRLTRLERLNVSKFPARETVAKLCELERCNDNSASVTLFVSHNGADHQQRDCKAARFDLRGALSFD